MIKKLKVSKWFVKTAILTPILGCAMLVSSATADILFEDIYYWGVDGIDASDDPTQALIKIQETVYNSDQGSSILASAIANGWVDGPSDVSVGNLYVYSITNLQGNQDVTSFNIQSSFQGPSFVYAPTSAFGAWGGSAGLGGFEWDVLEGETGIPVGFTHSGFMVVVPDGTPHSTQVNAQINGGAFSGIVSAPIPEPSTWALVGIGSIAMLALRRHRS